MNWEEFTLARLLLAEERVGSPVREHDRAEVAEEERGNAFLRANGMVG